MDLNLAGKSVIVTGGGSNIGRAICHRFGKEKARVVIAELDESQGNAVADEIRELGAEALFIQVGKASEIADAVCFLASDRAGHITGQTLSVSGGYTMM